MKKSFLFSVFASLLLLASCSNESDITDEIGNTEINSNSRIITSKQAESFGEKAINAIFSNKDFYKTKSGEILERKQNQDLKPQSVPIPAKDGKVVLYAINFGENNGFMIISADKESPFSMLAFNNSGHFEYNKLDKSSPFYVWLENQSERISKKLENTPNLTDEKYGIWKDMDGSTKDTQIEIELVNDVPIETKGRHKGSWNLKYETPFSTVRDCLWGQGRGYNANAKVSGAKAGCPAVAIGLLCKTHRFPKKYNYSGMPNVLNTNTSNPISIMFRDIADKIPGYFWGKKESGAHNASDILKGLHSIGYTKAKLGSYNFKTVYNNIKDWHPVLLVGYEHGGGHIWICDGYMEKKWKVTRKFLGIKIKKWYEYQDMLYMNWGWNGQDNAWIDQASWSHYNNGRQMLYDLEPVK